MLRDKLSIETIERISKLVGSKPEPINYDCLKWHLFKEVELSLQISTVIDEKKNERLLLSCMYNSTNIQPKFDGMISSNIIIDNEKNIMHFISLMSYSIEQARLGIYHAERMNLKCEGMRY